jgi:hypothetical protein
MRKGDARCEWSAIESMLYTKQIKHKIDFDSAQRLSRLIEC